MAIPVSIDNLKILMGQSNPGINTSSSIIPFATFHKSGKSTLFSTNTSSIFTLSSSNICCWTPGVYQVDFFGTGAVAVLSVFSGTLASSFFNSAKAPSYTVTFNNVTTNITPSFYATNDPIWSVSGTSTSITTKISLPTLMVCPPMSYTTIHIAGEDLFTSDNTFVSFSFGTNINVSQTGVSHAFAKQAPYWGMIYKIQ